MFPDPGCAPHESGALRSGSPPPKWKELVLAEVPVAVLLAPVLARYGQVTQSGSTQSSVPGQEFDDSPLSRKQKTLNQIINRLGRTPDFPESCFANRA